MLIYMKTDLKSKYTRINKYNWKLLSPASEHLSTLHSPQKSLNHRLTFKKLIWWYTKSNKTILPNKFCTSDTEICPLVPVLNAKEKNTQERNNKSVWVNQWREKSNLLDKTHINVRQTFKVRWNESYPRSTSDELAIGLYIKFSS